ncbi:hypothetical protein GCM10009601_40610 [Streptomyces thermospinosisporus]|uniref:Uncharacterized protein n=1 Tax=Streptomyces thermospinosisporus TaxID=161482 RepID=A0ABN1Z5B6_9ACTN
MAFGVEELRVLRRALALALHPTSASAEDVQDCLRLADSLDEATRESARLRAFLVADLGRYRAALPGTAAGYLTLLEEALGAGYRPVPDDLAALRALRGNPAAATLLHRCQHLAEQDVRSRLASRSVPAPAAPAEETTPATMTETAPATPATPAAPATPAIPASRKRTRTRTRPRATATHLLALPGGQSASAGTRQGDEQPEQPTRKPTPSQPQQPKTQPKTQPKPATPASPGGPGATPGRNRPIPTPGEVFPRRKPTPPPPPPDQQLAAG